MSSSESKSGALPSIWMFGGQGSQYFGMARDLYASEPVFARAIAACHEITAPLIGSSLIDLIYGDYPDRFAPFDRLLHSNPAICAVQYGVAELLTHRGHRADMVLGYSLGTITAEIVAGVRSLEDGLRLAVRLAELTAAHGEPGGMLAVLAPFESFADTWTAARNFSEHFVVTGRSAALGHVERELVRRRVPVQRLPVHFAFHCPLMDPIEAEFVRFERAQAQRPATVPFVAPTTIWNAIRQPVELMTTVNDLERRGAYRYIDLGPSGTLATFVKYNLRSDSASRTFSTVTPYDRARQNLECLEDPVAGRGVRDLRIGR